MTERDRRQSHVFNDLAAAMRSAERGHYDDALVKVENARVVLLALVVEKEHREMRRAMADTDLSDLRRGGL